jgi:CheY-like chemotaxis protein
MNDCKNNDLNILYVEDNEGDIELLTMCIERYYPAGNVVLEIAESIEEAIALFNEHKHIAALIDWNLPDGEGIEVAKHIRSIHQNLPIFFLSGVLNNKHLTMAKQYSNTEFLEKNYNKDFIENIYQRIQSPTP